ncbi:MAG: hypothetical protein ACKOTZ_11745, partial [Chloroflexota bacterium]
MLSVIPARRAWRIGLALAGALAFAACAPAPAPTPAPTASPAPTATLSPTAEPTAAPSPVPTAGASTEPSPVPVASGATAGAPDATPSVDRQASLFDVRGSRVCIVNETGTPIDALSTRSLKERVAETVDGRATIQPGDRWCVQGYNDCSTYYTFERAWENQDVCG